MNQPLWAIPIEIDLHLLSLSIYFRARGGSTAASRTVLYSRLFSDRDVQLSTTDNFLPKNGKCCNIKYYVRKNPKSVKTKYSTL